MNALTVRPRTETTALLDFTVNGRRVPLKIDRRNGFRYFVSHHFMYVGGPPEKYTDHELELLARLSERLDAEWTSRRWPGGGFDGDAGIYFDKDADSTGKTYGWIAKRESWGMGSMVPTLPQGLSRFYRNELLRKGHWACLADLVPRQVMEAEGVLGHSASLAMDDGFNRAYVLRAILLAAPTREELDEMITLHVHELAARKAA